MEVECLLVVVEVEVRVSQLRVDGGQGSHVAGPHLDGCFEEGDSSCEVASLAQALPLERQFETRTAVPRRWIHGCVRRAASGSGGARGRHVAGQSGSRSTKATEQKGREGSLSPCIPVTAVNADSLLQPSSRGDRRPSYSVTSPLASCLRRHSQPSFRNLFTSTSSSSSSCYVQTTTLKRTS